MPFLAMELLEGLPLDALLQTGRQLTLRQILRIGREIALWRCAAGQSALAEIASSRTIRELMLVDTPATDTDLAHLGQMKNLQRLQLARTTVTAAGVQKLAAALPRCRIEWDGGVIEAKTVQ